MSGASCQLATIRACWGASKSQFGTRELDKIRVAKAMLRHWQINDGVIASPRQYDWYRK